MGDACIQELQPKIVAQTFDNLCTMELSIRKGESEMLIGKLSGVDGASVEIKESIDEE